MATTERKVRATRTGTNEDRDELVLWRHIAADLQVLGTTRTKTNTLLEQLNQLYASSDQVPERRAVQKGERLCEEAMETVVEVKSMADRLKERLGVLIALREAADTEGIKVTTPSSPSVGTPTASHTESSRRRKRHSESEPPETPVRKPRGSPTKKSIAISAGQRVAAKVSSGDDDVDEWILAVVKRYFAEKQVYEVEDAEEDDSGNIATYQLPPKYILTISNTGMGHRSGEFAIGHTVLALYPNTTCFYKATVTMPPSKVRDPRCKGQYVVQFDDDNEQAQAVPANMVLDYPKQVD
ncbi:SGF29 tudor-like domain-containing protein [Syncephalis fuscata]|nr:SGF29 tudor-like domain-containing protein [Syncephalis fuscata]